MGIGDITVQTIEKMNKSSTLTRVGSTISRSTGSQNALDKKTIDWSRVGRMCTIGIILGPFNHGWYSLLDRVMPGRTGRIVVKKILCDQLVASPFFAFAFFMGMGTLEGQKFQVSLDEFKSKFWSVYKADWTVWPAAQAFNFACVPSQFRVLYVATITLGWNTFLSYIKHRDRLERLERRAGIKHPHFHMIQPRH